MRAWDRRKIRETTRHSIHISNHPSQTYSSTTLVLSQITILSEPRCCTYCTSPHSEWTFAFHLLSSLFCWAFMGLPRFLPRAFLVAMPWHLGFPRSLLDRSRPQQLGRQQKRSSIVSPKDTGRYVLLCLFRHTPPGLSKVLTLSAPIQIVYLLDNFEQETTTCRDNGGECKRDAEPIRRVLGLRSTTDPLFQIEKVFNKVKYMDLDPDKLDVFFEASEDWNSAMNMSNSMAFISQFGVSSDMRSWYWRSDKQFLIF